MVTNDMVKVYIHPAHITGPIHNIVNFAALRAVQPFKICKCIELTLRTRPTRAVHFLQCVTIKHLIRYLNILLRQLNQNGLNLALDPNKFGGALENKSNL